MRTGFAKSMTEKNNRWDSKAWNAAKIPCKNRASGVKQVKVK